jgi:hypothetical protein
MKITCIKCGKTGFCHHNLTQYVCENCGGPASILRPAVYDTREDMEDAQWEADIRSMAPECDHVLGTCIDCGADSEDKCTC